MLDEQVGCGCMVCIIHQHNRNSALSDCFSSFQSLFSTFNPVTPNTLCRVTKRESLTCRTCTPHSPFQPRKKHVTWDEATIAEQDKDRGTRCVIDEPKTPYVRQTFSDGRELERLFDRFRGGRTRQSGTTAEAVDGTGRVVEGGSATRS